MAIFTSCHQPGHFAPDAGDLLANSPFRNLTDSISQFSTDAGLYFRRAELLALNKQRELAEADYRKSWDLKPDPATALRRSSNLSIMGKTSQALDFLKECIAKYPQEPEFKRMQAEEYIGSGQAGKAIGLYDSLLKLNPGDFESWYEMGRLLAEAKDTTGALNALSKACELQPTTTYTLELAHLYAEHRDNNALVLCDQVIKEDSARELIDPFFIKGIYYSNTRDYEKAIIQFDSCIGRDWKFTDAYIEKGLAYFKQDNFDMALKVFSMAATVSNTSPDAYYWMGRCYEAAGKKQEAAAFYQRALGLDREFYEARQALQRVEKVGS
jgi:Flp pilus assembly protein TadD